MKYKDLDKYWQRIFELEWESLCEGSKAIAALIVSDSGEIISEGRNQIGEITIPNPRVSHAEVEAIRSLDIRKHPHVKSYTLYAALEPCPMCMGTLVMGGIRKVVIGAKDDYGGAMGLIEHSGFLKAKNIQVTWMPQEYGNMQRGFQALKELLYNKDAEKLQEMLEDFAVYNEKGVTAAKALVASGFFETKQPDGYGVEVIFDRMSDLIGAAANQE